MIKLSLTELRNAIREQIMEALANEADVDGSAASKEAKQKGLEYLSFGRYGKDGHTTHRVINGKLQPVNAQSSADASGLNVIPGQPPTDKPMARPQTGVMQNAPVAQYNPAQGKFHSLTAKNNKNNQHTITHNRDRTGTSTPTTDPLTKYKSAATIGASPLQPAIDHHLNRISNQVKSSGLLDDASGQQLSRWDFLKQSGITNKEFKFLLKLGPDATKELYDYDPNTDTVRIADPIPSDDMY